MTIVDLTQVVHVIPFDIEKLPWLLEQIPKMINDVDILMFASKIVAMDEIKKQLAQTGFEVAPLHGN